MQLLGLILLPVTLVTARANDDFPKSEFNQSTSTAEPSLSQPADKVSGLANETAGLRNQTQEGEIPGLQKQCDEDGLAGLPNSCKEDDSAIKSIIASELPRTIADLGQRVYNELAKTEKGNFLFSPLSLHSALSLVLLATNSTSQTYEEVQNMLGRIVNVDVLKLAYRNLLKDYKDQPTFLINSHVWVDERFQLNPTYVAEASKYLGIDTTSLRFEDKAAALNAINQWVEEATAGRIPSAMDSIGEDVKVILGNALFLKEKWKIAFREVDAQDKPLTNQRFQLPNDEVARVDMMETENINLTFGKIRLPEQSIEHDVITIPYKNPDFALQIILPRRDLFGDGLSILEGQIKNMLERDIETAVIKDDYATTNVFLQPQNQAWRRYLLRLPKFKISSKFDAADIFKRMNYNRVFSGEAELEGLSADGSRLSIDSITHTALIDVDQQGTEAAASTEVQIVFLSALASEPTLVIDVPFIFIVRDMVHGIPVLVGRVTNPAQLV